MTQIRSQSRTGIGRWVLACALLLALPLVTGCQGCRNDPDDSGDLATNGSGDQGKQPKEPFKFDKLAALPDLEDPANQAKPGHWIAGHRQITSNDYDFQGSLEGRVIDGKGNPIPTELTNHFLTTERPISLPKGTTKDVEVMFYVPRRLEGENALVTLEQELYDRRGRKVEIPNGAVNLMPEYRFFLIVLSNNPGRYSYVKTLTAINVPGDEGRKELFRVVTPTITSYVPLPSDSEGWTSFAFLLWDDLDPVQLEPSQQQSLLDWLHFGGQLIVSGPDALDKLANSFLGPYLPVVTLGARELGPADVAAFSDHWSIASAKGMKEDWQITETSRILGAELELKGGGSWMPMSEGLVAENSVGRGRIVVTGFPLGDRSLLTWPSFDSFFHNALLRRPRRDFKVENRDLSGKIPFYFQAYPGAEFDPRFSSTLRYVSRDLGFASIRGPLEAERPRVDKSEESGEAGKQLPSEPASVRPAVTQSNLTLTPAEIAELEHWHFGGYERSTLSGVAGWNDQSAVANLCRDVLDSSAGISPPSSRFVLAALVAYLAVLVPLNWVVFRLIGRVEWAWIAAPVLAILAAILIVRMARLDIGFARSQTELTIVELQPDYSRGHVTRYSSLYTSLSTEFAVDFSTDDARGQPWGSPTAARTRGQTPDREVRLSQSGGLKLTNLLVSSNSAEMLHVEQMIDIGGPFELLAESSTGSVLLNRSKLTIHDVGLLGKNDQGQLVKAWIGDMTPGGRSEVKWTPATARSLTFEQWQENPVTRSFSTLEKQWFDELDSDGDQTISLNELRSHPQYAAGWEKWFEDADRPLRDSGQQAGGQSGGDEQEQRTLDAQEFSDFLVRMPTEELWLGGLFELFGEQLVLRQAGIILLGWSDEPIAGAALRPLPSQTRRRTIVLAHLKGPRWNAVAPDANLFSDVNLIDEDEPIEGLDEGGTPDPAASDSINDATGDGT